LEWSGREHGLETIHVKGITSQSKGGLTMNKCGADNIEGKAYTANNEYKVW
jgi:hypothetical protein